MFWLGFFLRHLYTFDELYLHRLRGSGQTYFCKNSTDPLIRLIDFFNLAINFDNQPYIPEGTNRTPQSETLFNPRNYHSDCNSYDMKFKKNVS